MIFENLKTWLYNFEIFKYKVFIFTDHNIQFYFIKIKSLNL